VRRELAATWSCDPLRTVPRSSAELVSDESLRMEVEEKRSNMGAWGHNGTHANVRSQRNLLLGQYPAADQTKCALDAERS